MKKTCRVIKKAVNMGMSSERNDAHTGNPKPGSGKNRTRFQQEGPSRQLKVSWLGKYKPADYVQRTFPSARPLFCTPVKELKHNSRNKKNGLQLKRRTSTHDEILHNVLINHANGKKWSAWSSDTLWIELSLLFGTRQPESILHQVLFIAEDQPPFFWSLARASDEENQQDTEAVSVRTYTTEMARHLTSAVANFSSCDILVLPCTSFGAPDSTEEELQRKLQAEIGQHVDSSQSFYGGPLQLTTESYEELKRAEYLTLLDRDWRDTLSIFTDKQNYSNIPVKVTFKTDAKFKATAAMLEAGRRLSYRDQAVIVTSDADIQRCVEKIKQKTKEEDAVDLQLSCLSEMQARPSATFTIFCKFPDIYLSGSVDV
ncbi:hypothetical protein BaRGS_00040177 [Batillaria attramentaria]|uniref:PIN domain-containing protein n=1 Tax=Batillaria attramentaria TaxID=370345 RepID=A0ABD0J118_9CAEN